jgi:uncharacterized membrane protein
VYSPHHPLLVALFILIFVLLLTALLFELTGIAFGELGFGRIGAALVVGGSLLGSFVDLPIAKIEANMPELVNEYVIVFGKPYRVRTARANMTIVAVNVGGALIPTLVSCYLLFKDPATIPQCLLGVAVVSLAMHIVARPTRGVGIVAPTFVAPLVSAALALLIPSGIPYVTAYVSGVLGTLIGADLTNLPSVYKIGGGVVSIGGAGTFDGIFLSGILAVLLAR